MAAREQSSAGTILCSFSTSSSPRFNQSFVSPQRLNRNNLRFPLDRSISSIGSRSVVSGQKPPPRPTCLCSPTTHPGYFRCARHRRSGIGGGKTLTSQGPSSGPSPSPSPSPSQSQSPIHEFPVSDGLNLRRLTMVNSVLRIGGVEGELAMRTMAALTRSPSSQNLRRRSEFRPRPSRFSPS